MVTIVTVFRSRLRPGVEEGYSQVAGEMSALVRTVRGFVDEKLYLSPDGERVTVVRFADLESHRSWANHPEHRAAQLRGRAEFYSWFDISVCEELHARIFEAPDT